MSNQILTQPGPQILPWRVKICFGAGGFAKALLAVTMAAFMIFFYVDVCGIPNRVAAAIVLVAKIWDIINDPMMGRNSRQNEIKRRQMQFLAETNVGASHRYCRMLFFHTGNIANRSVCLGCGYLCASEYGQHDASHPAQYASGKIEHGHPAKGAFNPGRRHYADAFSVDGRFSYNEFCGRIRRRRYAERLYVRRIYLCGYLWRLPSDCLGCNAQL